MYENESSEIFRLFKKKNKDQEMFLSTEHLSCINERTLHVIPQSRSNNKKGQQSSARRLSFFPRIVFASSTKEFF